MKRSRYAQGITHIVVHLTLLIGLVSLHARAFLYWSLNENLFISISSIKRKECKTALRFRTDKSRLTGFEPILSELAVTSSNKQDLFVVYEDQRDDFFDGSNRALQNVLTILLKVKVPR